MSDPIDRQAAIDALWEALYEYEDKTEEQFLESEELDIATWFLHRIFVENMSDIDRQTILNLPSLQPERKKGKWIDNNGLYQCSACKHIWSELWWSASCPIDRMYKTMRYCPSCGAEMREEN